MTTRIVDLTVPLEPGTPVYPEYEPFKFSVLETAEDPPKGRRSLNSSRVAFGLHSGTHMDAPLHFYPSVAAIDEVALAQCIGPALLLHLPKFARGGTIEASDLEGYKPPIAEVRKVVLDTGWRSQWGKAEYFSDHPVISGDAARFLVACGVHLVGLDTPSVDRAPFAAHLEFLGNGVVILENLTNLEQIRGEVFDLVALPLRLKAREASPVRAIAVERD